MLSSRGWKLVAVFPLIGALAGLAGCMQDVGSSKSPEPTESAAQPLAQQGQAPEADRHHGMRPPPGPAFLLVAAMHELDLTDAQKTTIQGALDKLAPPKDHPPMDHAPFAALAEGVRAGKLDPATVLAKVPGEDRAAEHGAAFASALQTLHDTLTKEQRRALVDAVAKHAPEHGPPPGMMHGGPKGEKGEHEHGAAGGPLGHLLSGLNLSDSQRESIDKALAAQRPAAPAAPDAEAMKKHFEAGHAEMHARLEGFAADTFDAKAFVAPPEGAPAMGPNPHIERMVKDLAVVVPLLDQAQREALAVELEKGPPAHPMGHPARKDD